LWNGQGAAVDGLGKLNMQQEFIDGTEPAEKPDKYKECDEFFEKFWTQYPKHRKINKVGARKAFHKHWDAKELTAEKVPALMSNLEIYKVEWKRRASPSLTPHPQTFINRCPWDDEIETDKPSEFARGTELDGAF